MRKPYAPGTGRGRKADKASQIPPFDTISTIQPLDNQLHRLAN